MLLDWLRVFEIVKRVVYSFSLGYVFIKTREVYRFLGHDRCFWSSYLFMFWRRLSCKERACYRGLVSFRRLLSLIFKQLTCNCWFTLHVLFNLLLVILHIINFKIVVILSLLKNFNGLLLFTWLILLYRNLFSLILCKVLALYQQIVRLLSWCVFITLILFWLALIWVKNLPAIYTCVWVTSFAWHYWLVSFNLCCLKLCLQIVYLVDIILLYLFKFANLSPQHLSLLFKFIQFLLNTCILFFLNLYLLIQMSYRFILNCNFAIIDL